MKRIALIGDSSDHGGVLVSTNQTGSLKVNDIAVAVAGATHSCPIPGHGATLMTAVTIRTYHEGKLILTESAMAECGALLVPQDRGVYVE